MKIYTLIAFMLLVCNSITAQFYTENENTIQGGALIINPTAQPDIICPGQTVQLFSQATGGLNNYTYSWTSNPPGYISNLAEPFVSPGMTTVYTVQVSDGISTTTGSVTVTVMPGPRINLIPENTTGLQILSSSEISTCPFTSVILDAGNQGCTYLWANGATSRTITASTSGITSDIQEFHVTVTNPANGCSSEADMVVYFLFDNCTYGIDENNTVPDFQVYPNPSNDGIISYIVNGIKGDYSVRIISSYGNIVFEELIPHKSPLEIKKTIDLSRETPGTYILQVISEQKSLTKKILIR